MLPTDLVFRLLLVVALVLVNGFFAGAEVALVSVRNSRLRQMAEDGVVGAAAALSLLANPERLLSVVQVGVTATSLGLGWAGEPTVYAVLVAVLGPLWRPEIEFPLRIFSFVLAFSLISYFHVVFGEVLPKNMAISRADRLAVLVAPPLLLFYRLTLPFVVVIERSAAAIGRMLGIGGGAVVGHSTEELKLIVSSSRMVPEEQGEMIHRILDLNQTSVRAIMVPRKDIHSISVDATLDQVLQTMIEQQHSRLPVWEGKPEHIIGILHYKDLLPVWEESKAAARAGRAPSPFQVRLLMRKHLVVPETKSLSQMLAEFKQGRSHMAMVVDEFGTIVGLVTVEDVLEAIVGAISDEYDEKAVVPVHDETAAIEIDGATRIRDLQLDYDIEIPADLGFETLAGFLLYKLGYIPSVGAAVEHDGRRFTVVEMDRNRIARVRIEKLAVAPPVEGLP